MINLPENVKILIKKETDVTVIFNKKLLKMNFLELRTLIQMSNFVVDIHHHSGSMAAMNMPRSPVSIYPGFERQTAIRKILDLYNAIMMSLITIYL